MYINFINHCLDSKSIGGVNRVTIDLANNLCQKKGLEVNIISLGFIDKPPYTVNPNVSIEELRLKKYSTTHYKGIYKIIWFYNSYRTLDKYIKTNLSKDEICIFTSPPLCILASVLKFKHKKNIFIGHEHTSTNYSKGRIIDFVKYRFYKKLEVMISMTEDDTKKYEKLGVKSCYIPNYFDKNIIKSDVLNSRKYVLYVGRFSLEKQPLIALEIYFKSKLYESGVLFRMFGIGDCEEEIFKYINENNIYEYVEIFNDITDHNKIYENAYALILTSKIEGFGMVLIEAISRNIPCIAFDVPSGPRSIIQNGKNGYLLDPKDISGFTQKLASKEILKLHNLDISHTVEKYNKNTVLDKWLKLFKRLSCG